MAVGHRGSILRFPRYRVSAAVSPLHLGTVSVRYAPGSVVTLTATELGDGRFVNWSGDLPGGESTVNPLMLTLSGDAGITASYSRPVAAPVFCGAASVELGALMIIFTWLTLAQALRGARQAIRLPGSWPGRRN